MLRGVWHNPKLSRKLFSIGRFTKDVGPITFESDGCFVKAKGMQWKLGAREGKMLYKLCMMPVSTDEANVTSSSGCHGDTTLYLWHLVLGTLDIVVLTLSSKETMVLALILRRVGQAVGAVR